MAVASVEENVKLKDLWQAKYTVAMLKSMKTVTFETPSGNHAYTVVMVVYSTQCVCVNFTGLVLGCIDAVFCKQILVRKLLTRSLTHFCTASNPTFKGFRII